MAKFDTKHCTVLVHLLRAKFKLDTSMFRRLKRDLVINKKS